MILFHHGSLLYLHNIVKQVICKGLCTLTDIAHSKINNPNSRVPPTNTDTVSELQSLSRSSGDPNNPGF